MTKQLPSFLDVSPFGPFCKECSLPLSIEKGILSHAKSSHPDAVFANGVVIRNVKEKVRHLRHVYRNDLSRFLLVPESQSAKMWFCTTCFVSFRKSSNFQRHLESKHPLCRDPPKSGKMTCYKTICGRFGPRTCPLPVAASTPVALPLMSSADTPLVSPLLSLPPWTAAAAGATMKTTTTTVPDVPLDGTVPPALMITHDDAVKILERFVRPDENVKDLSLIYYPLLSAAFEGTMREYIQYSSKQASEDAILTQWINTGKLWLTHYAAGHIANISANVSHPLAELEQNDVVGGTTDRTMVCFTLRRRGIPRLVEELEAALRFFYRYPTTLFDEFKSKDVKNSDPQKLIAMAIIPRILYKAAKEEPTHHGQLPVACRYCLSRGFTRKNQTQQLVMNECGWIANRISDMMHLLHAGVCGYLVTLAVPPESQQSLSMMELEIVKSIQQGRVTNLLAPYIQQLRDWNSGKPLVNKNSRVNSNGDITSGAFTFRKSIWSTMIPRIMDIAKACFANVFKGNTWQYFLSLPISVANWMELEASVTTSESTICLLDLEMKENIDYLIGQLQALGELCLLGLGFGAVPYEELTRLTASSFQWHNSYLYYWTPSSSSLKQDSLLPTKNTPRMVEHRLSLTLSRVFLLLRFSWLASGYIGSDEILPSLPGDTCTSMLSLVRDVFDFDDLPQLLNVSHFFLSVSDTVLLETNRGEVDGEAPTSGQTHRTGRRGSETCLETSDEFMYDLYHKSLGEIFLDPPVITFTPYSDSVLEAGLQELLGQQATFRSSQQRQMVDIAANSFIRHAYVRVPCGHGSSLSWMVPIMASLLSGRKIGLRIVIVPYKFWLGHVVEQARSMVGLHAERIRIEYLDSLDFDSLSSMLKEKVPPALLFLNLDSASALVRFHLGTLQKLSTNKVLHRIYIDEFQQMIVEFGCGQAYRTLCKLGQIGCPVMCLSGSMPTSIATSLMSYCRLLAGPTATFDPMDIIQGLDPIGTGFVLDVRIVHNVEDSIVESVMKRKVSSCHVICDTNVLVEKVKNLLSNHCSILALTEDTPRHEQIQTARDWASGTHNVLVSTIVGLVGIHNKKCRKIIIGGLLYNISSLVQAIGQLRPDQRGQGAMVEVHRLRFDSKTWQDAKQTEEISFQKLLASTCLPATSRDDYIKIFSPVGLQRFLSLKEGCYLQTLSLYYGFARSPCRQCRLCQEATEESTTNATVESSLPSPKCHKRTGCWEAGSPQPNKRGK